MTRASGCFVLVVMVFVWVAALGPVEGAEPAAAPGSASRPVTRGTSRPSAADPAKLATLRAALRDPSVDVRSKAVNELRQMRPFDTGVAEVMALALDDPRLVNQALLAIDSRVRGGDAPEAARLLVEAIKNPATHRQAAERAQSHLQALYEFVPPLLDDKDAQVRAVATRMITGGRYGSAAHVRKLREMAAKDPDEKVRQGAQRTLEYLRSICRLIGDSFSPEQEEGAVHVVKDLVAELAEGGEKIPVERRTKLVAQLGQYGPVSKKGGVAAVVGALKDSDPQVRLTAANVLREMGKDAGPEAARALSAALNDPDEKVRRNAQTALSTGVGRADDKAVASVISSADPKVRLGAVNSMDPAANVDVLRKAAREDKDAAVRARAVYRLAGAGVGLDAVLRARRDQDEKVREQARNSVEGLHYPGRRHLIGPVIEQLGSKDETVRVEAAINVGRDADLLRRWNDAAVREGIKKAAAVLLGAVKAEKDEQTLKRMTSALWAAREEAAAGILEMSRDPSPKVRQLSIPLSDGEMGRKIRAQLLGDPDADVRFAVTEALYREPETGLPVLLAAMSDPRAEARVAASDTLSRVEFAPHLSGPRLKALSDVFLGALRDSRWEVRSQSAEILGRLRVAEATGALVALADDSDKHVRISVARALAVLAREDERALDTLLKLSRDEDRLVREHALVSLGRGWGRHGTDAQVAKIVTAMAETLKRVTAGKAAEGTWSYPLDALGAIGADAAAAKPVLKDLRAKNAGEAFLVRKVDEVVARIEEHERAVAEMTARVKALVSSDQAKDWTAAWQALGQDRQFPIRHAARLLRPLLEHKDPQAFSAGIVALANMREGQDSIRYAKAVEINDIEGLKAGDAANRRVAVENIAMLGPAGRNAYLALLDVVKTDADPSVREAARRALSGMFAGKYLANGAAK